MVPRRPNADLARTHRDGGLRSTSIEAAYRARKLPPCIRPRIRRCASSLDGAIWLEAVASGCAQCRLRWAAWWTITETLPHLAPSLLAKTNIDIPIWIAIWSTSYSAFPASNLRAQDEDVLLCGVPSTRSFQLRFLAQTKGFSNPRPLALSKQRKIEAMFAESCAADDGFIDPALLRAALQLTVRGIDHKWRRALMNTIAFELWLRAQRLQRANVSRHATNYFCSSKRADKFPAGQIAG